MPHHPNCFMATLEAASDNTDAVVVHAWLEEGGSWFVHAWVENDEVVLDLTLSRQPIERAEYYRERHVREDRLLRYTRQRFFELSAESGSFGPFDTEYFNRMELADEPGDAPKG